MDLPISKTTTVETDDWIRHGTPAFRATNLALFAAGLSTFGLLYCVQPLMPEFSRHYGIDAATRDRKSVV